MRANQPKRRALCCCISLALGAMSLGHAPRALAECTQTGTAVKCTGTTAGNQDLSQPPYAQPITEFTVENGATLDGRIVNAPGNAPIVVNLDGQAGAPGGMAVTTGDNMTLNINTTQLTASMRIRIDGSHNTINYGAGTNTVVNDGGANAIFTVAGTEDNTYNVAGRLEAVSGTTLQLLSNTTTVNLTDGSEVVGQLVAIQFVRGDGNRLDAHGAKIEALHPGFAAMRVLSVNGTSSDGDYTFVDTTLTSPGVALAVVQSFNANGGGIYNNHFTFDGTTLLSGAFNGLRASGDAGTYLFEGDARVEATTGSGISTRNGNGYVVLDTDRNTFDFRGTATVVGGNGIAFEGGNGQDVLQLSENALLDGNVLLGDGDDAFTLGGGTLNGLLDLGAGADTATFSGVDTATFTTLAQIDGGADNDTLAIDGVATVDGTNVVNFERLLKQGAGTGTLTGEHGYDDATIAEGTLAVDGLLETPLLALQDDTTVKVSGGIKFTTLTTTFNGSAGANAVVIDAAGTVLGNGDLGDGADLLDVAGTLHTGLGVFSLGDGDDTFTIYDGTVVTGIVDGGAGLDTQLVDTAGAAQFGALLNFEALAKAGTGTLQVTGPATTSLTEVHVLEGTLDVTAQGSVVDARSTTVAAGATLQVDGAYMGSAGADTMTVAGTVAGTGPISLGDGDDMLLLEDGAVLTARIDAGDGAADVVDLDNAIALTIDGSRVGGFELLNKENAGTAVLTGDHAFAAGVTVTGGALDVAGSLTTQSVVMSDDTLLQVDGTLQSAAFNGTAGANTVAIGDAGTLVTAGTLGDGADVLDVHGTLVTGVAGFDLGDGDDVLLVHDNAAVDTVLAGAGTDGFGVDVAGSASVVSAQGFDVLQKTGNGELHFTGADSSFDTVLVQAGTVAVDAGASVTEVGATNIAGGTTLQVDGNLAGTAGDDALRIEGRLSGAGRVGLGAGSDWVEVLGNGSADALVSGEDGADTFVIDGNGAQFASLDGGVDAASDRLVLQNHDWTYTSADAARAVNFERWELTGTSVLTLQDNMALGNAFSGNGTLSIGAWARVLVPAGARLVQGSVEHAGEIMLANGRAGDVLTITGDYVGQGGTLALDAVLEGDNAATDRLVVQGNANGQAWLSVHNLHGLGAATNDGIRVVEIGGASNATFSLSGRAVAGPFEYLLQKGTRTADDGNWYLRSSALSLSEGICRPEDAAYLGMQSADALMFAHTQRDRGGDPGLSSGGNGGNAGWLRATGGNVQSGACDGQLDMRTDRWAFLGGIDSGQWELASGVMRAGLMGGYGQATTQGYSNVTTYTATGRSKGRSLGGYATWFSDPRMQTGLTLDGVILEASFDNAVSGAQLPTENYDSRNTQLSIEADYAFALTAPGGVALYLQPQVQFTYFDLDTNPHLEANGTLVESRTEDLWQSRVGLRLYGHAETAQGSVVQPFAELDWLHGSDPDVLAFDGIVVEADTPQDRYALRGGLAFALSHGATVWAKFGIEDGADDYRSIEGGMGIRFDW